MSTSTYLPSVDASYCEYCRALLDPERRVCIDVRTDLVYCSMKCAKLNQAKNRKESKPE